MSPFGYSEKDHDRFAAPGTVAVVGLFLLCFLTTMAWGQSGPLSYSGTTMYTPAKRLGVVGYSNGEKRQTVPPPRDLPVEPDQSEQLPVRIPVTSSTQIDGQTVSLVVPQSTTDTGAYSFDTQGIPRSWPREQDAASITADDRLGQFMLFPRPVRDSLFQGAGVDLAYVPNRKQEQAGFYRASASVTLGIPAPSTQTPLLISPMFAWDRMTLPDATNGLFDKDVNLYAPGIRTQYLIPVNSAFMFDFGISFQWTSDFKFSGSDHVLLGGYGSVVLKMDEVTRLVAGVGYYDACRYKILPFGGLLWRASEQLYLEIVFPKPRISWRLPESMQGSERNASYWFYLTADYNAQRWSIHQDHNLSTDSLKGEYRLVCYDIRFMAGLEKKTQTEISWALEGGLVFNRHLDISGRNNTSSYQEKFTPKPAGIVQMKFRY